CARNGGNFNYNYAMDYW
nr:immunoglobulin heavy chain junction region [Mus musculus]MBK4187775.1 immunoglobulin heavy chain junction region [Mus musculus]